MNEDGRTLTVSSGTVFSRKELTFWRQGEEFWQYETWTSSTKRLILLSDVQPCGVRLATIAAPFEVPNGRDLQDVREAFFPDHKEDLAWETIPTRSDLPDVLDVWIVRP